MSLSDQEAQLALLEDQLALFTPKPNTTTLSLFYAHGWAFCFAWCIFSILQIASARYMRHKWETNMVLHTATGMLITVTTCFWGFWAIDLKTFNPGNGQYIGKNNTDMQYFHSFAGIITALLGVPLIITGFIAYFRRW